VQKPGGPVRPRAADVAFGLVLGAAAAVLILAATIPMQISPTVDSSRAAASAQHLSVAALQHELVVVSVFLVAVGAVLAGLLVLFAFRFRGGHRRARIGVIVITLVLVASLDVPLILTAVVLVVADVLMFVQPVATWLRAVAPARALKRR
jgi:hypothetical protein